MYADSITPSMERAIMETERRRGIQEAYNAANGITPKTIVKEISGMGVLEISSKDDSADKPAKRMEPRGDRAEDQSADAGDAGSG